jgi:hypothetical protein
MISNAVIDEIRRLLRDKKFSQRKIALRLGVSRGTVNSVATGKRPNCNKREKNVENEFVPPSGLPQRCPQCGARVMMPCLACRVRALRAARKPKREQIEPPQTARC